MERKRVHVFADSFGGPPRLAKCRRFADETSASLLKEQWLGAQDALKHCLLACCLAQRFPLPFVIDTLNNHEGGRAGAADRHMDNTNNALGIALGLAKKDCKGACIDAIVYEVAVVLVGGAEPGNGAATR